MWAYRKELWALKAEGVLILIPALLGGAVGAWALLKQTKNEKVPSYSPVDWVF